MSILKIVMGCVAGGALMFSAQAVLAADSVYYQYNLAMKACDNGDGTYSQCVKMVGANGVASSVPVAATTTTTNGTVAVGNTYQSALAANANRKGCLIVNKSVATILVYVGAPGSATAAQSVILNAGTATADGGTFSCALANGVVITDQISVTSATATSAFLVMTQ